MNAPEERQQFSGVSWLDDVGVCAEVVGTVHVSLFGGRTVHHGDQTLEFRSRSDVVENVKAGFARHLDVEQ